jgi:cold shock CspA family protein/ribosome-associated translation inhibitor RaiA
MQEPLQIGFHNMASSPALEQRVRERFEKLERRHGNIISARVVIEAPHKQPHKSTMGISLSIGVPGRDISVKREQRVLESNQHVIYVINEAFEAAERQLDDYSQVRRHEVKAHDAENQYGHVVRLYRDQSYGFIETRERQEIYFHRDVVRNGSFEELEEGCEVLYTLADGEGPMGPMASSINVVRGEHPVR